MQRGLLIVKILEDSLQECSLENYIIKHCAPTLAGIKSAGLFSFRFESGEFVAEEILRLNTQLNEKGVFIKLMLLNDDYALIYTYRKSHLEKELMQDGVRNLLMSYGYPDADTEELLRYLKKRLRNCDGFPHEIGVFLGYPLEDVKGFIKNKGRDCKCCGLWKVYCNECEAMKLFAKIQKCTRVYLEVFAQGRHITQMTVCA